jgi:hypothetical protein
MNSRERVLAAIEHRPVDRVPVDLGGSIMSGIMALTMDRVRRYLGITERPVKVYELYQMLGEVEDDLIERFGVDVLPVEPPSIFFDIPRENYKPFTLFDGTGVLVPGQFEVVEDAAGNWVVHDGGDPARPASGVMPKDGYYFDKLPLLKLEPDFQMPPLSELEPGLLAPIPDDVLDHVAATAIRLRPTDKALLAGMWKYFGPPGNVTDPNWLCFLLTDAAYVDDMFAIAIEGNIRRLQQLHDRVGSNIDIIGLDGADYGSQRCELFSPGVFERHYLPFYRRQLDWVREHTTWKTWKHTCGSVPRLIPYLVECGLDCLNPVQCSASGMDARALKETYGEKLTFWGGGVDTQKTLPFGTPAEVRAEVNERLRIFADGGGYVFNTIHNIQASVPPENVVAMFDAVLEFQP